MPCKEKKKHTVAICSNNQVNNMGILLLSFDLDFRPPLCVLMYMHLSLTLESCFHIHLLKVVVVVGGVPKSDFKM